VSLSLPCRESREVKTLFTAEELVGGEAADGGVEELNHVKRRKGALAATAEAAHQLKETSGVARDDSLGVNVEEMTDFAVAKLPCWLGLEEVIDAGGATAKRGLGNLGHFKLGNSGEELAGLLVDSLSVAEVTSIVISDADR
jgi:hypothetical protein